ncbi:cysteine hydrolase [Clostridium sp. 'White wine YQ']|uniref:cysteine hydrolase n=1 Tax=Clostridium sp. 'White wine YQ' TaxID=3027474 RepID=UPI0023657FA8|nr:cysteine hydrolase [Clostridium sp. 'White wine YQ']MDD7793410.1 cysteine hydrolase [Clostridium sp. 'White wine YQ']
MIYFCCNPSEWFGYKDDENLKYRNYLPESDFRQISAGETILDIWNNIPTPLVPKLQSVTVNPKTTALLILDMQNSICKSPRCIETIPNINNLLTTARKNNMLIIYSLTNVGTTSDIFNSLTPTKKDPIVKSYVDKFYRTDLEALLNAKGIKTVIITGYAANGAVLHTATGAAFRCYSVILPVDCISAQDPYAEQYTLWHMLYSPGTKGHVTLTRSRSISF